MKSDRELIHMCIEGDRTAFVDLVQRYEKLVCATAVTILHERHAAEDVAQDTFVTAHENLSSI